MKHCYLYLMVGCPGSGKSTYIQNHLTENDVWISRDKIRFSLLSDKDNYFDKEKEVLKTFRSEINKNLKLGKNVYADATHLTTKSRRLLLDYIENKNAITIIALVIDTPLDICLKRNETRGGRSKVPEDQVIRMYHSMTMPDPYWEDINEVRIIEEND